MNRKTKYAVNALLAVSLMAGSAGAGLGAGVPKAAATVAVPKLLITEMVPNSVNMSSNDGYEYVELYNASDELMDLTGYKLRGKIDGVQMWEGTLGSLRIPPRESIVVWTQNSTISKLNPALTRDQFRTNYKVAMSDLPDDRIHLLQNVPGLYNGSSTQKNIGIFLVDPSDTEITVATYYVNGAGDTFENQSITFTQPASGNAMVHTGGNKTATPGRSVADEVPGTPPVGVSAVGGDHSLTVTWTPSGEPGVTGYRIYSQNGLPTASVTGATYTYTGLANGANYTFTLSCVYADGSVSPASAPVLGKAGIPVPPAVTTGLQALPRDKAIRLSWDAAAEGDIAGYRIYQNGTQLPDLVTSPAYVAEGLTNGESVTFAVYAVNQTGLQSAQPAVAVQKPQAAPPLVITEMASNTKNSDYKTGGTDAFEFIELYNSTGTPLNLKGFTLKYMAGATEYLYPISEDKIVAPQETFIIWFKNSNVLQVGLPEFNTAYGSAITENQLFVVVNGGMSNSAPRRVQLLDPDNRLLTDTAYAVEDVGESISANFIPDRAGGAVSTERFSKPANPGYLYPVQRVADPADGMPPAAPAGVQAIGGIGGVKVTWSKDLEPDVAYVNVYIDGTLAKQLLMPEKEAVIEGLANDKSVTVQVSAIDTSGRESVRSAPVTVTPTANEMPALLITELVPDTWNTEPLEARDVYDAYEFIELYNPHNEPIDLNGKSVRFTQPDDASKNWLWTFREQTLIQPHQSLQFWVRPSGLGYLKPDGFNFFYYGFQNNKYVPDSAIVLGDGAGGLTNTGGIVEIVEASGTVLARAAYTAGQFLEKKGITYAYPMFGGTEMRAVGVMQTGTPGIVGASQLPRESSEDTTAPATPAGLQAQPGRGEVSISWQPGADEDLGGYRLYVDGQLEATLPASDVSYKLAGLPGEVAVKVELSAVDHAGNESAHASATAKPGYPQMTQVERDPSPANAWTSSRYQEAWAIGGKGPIIPGLVQGHVPQGMSYYADGQREWILMAAYHFSGDPSTLAIVNAKTGLLEKYVHLKDTDGSIYIGHAGGVAVSKENVWLSSGKKMYRMPIQTLIDAPNEGFAQFADSFGVVTNASFAAYADGMLWVGEYSNPPSYTTSPSHQMVNRDGETHLSWIAAYPLDENDRLPASTPSFREENMDKYVPEYILSIGDKIQGVAFNKGEVLLTYNYGRPYNSILRFRMPKVADAATRSADTSIGGVTVPVWLLDSKNKLGSINVPTGAENMFIRKEAGDDHLYVNFESGANHMRFLSSYSMDRLLKLDLDRLRRGGNDASDSGKGGAAGPGVPGGAAKPERLQVTPEEIKPGGDAVELKLDSKTTQIALSSAVLAKMNGLPLEVTKGGVSLVIAGETLSAAGASASSGSQLVVTIKPAAAPDETKERRTAGDAFTIGLSMESADGTAAPVETSEHSLQVKLQVGTGYDPRLVGVYALDANGRLSYAGGEVKDGVLTLQIAATGTYVVQEYRKSYADVPSGHWSSEALQVLAAKHVADGVTEDTFAPNTALTRAELTALLVRAFGLTASGEKAPFADVQPQDWYAAAIAAAAANGLVSGVEPDRFAPNEPVTREQMAVLLVRAWERKAALAEGDASAQPFADAAAIADWAAPAVAKARSAGLLSGKEGDRFDPEAVTTRAEGAQAIYNALYK
ncbi:lamin tail domain-containing protein [Paenibacillus sp. GCM10023248]|uniref:lamin tail domain-containing protein n=1 Tax=unclassified Paenibacillus TaxID=185978 RepID=UPI0023798C16|nr:lamin tail domain-containing protein [Paenibacillus sp. MAHUQ-63]MDD9270766.1 lamin tail domain-containing protein [Paenibacillus sp. MAHUQ-63]